MNIPTSEIVKLAELWKTVKCILQFTWYLLALGKSMPVNNDFQWISYEENYVIKIIKQKHLTN